MRNTKGNIFAVVGFIKDITKCMHDEEKLKLLNETLEKRVTERTEELLKVNE